MHLTTPHPMAWGSNKRELKEDLIFNLIEGLIFYGFPRKIIRSADKLSKMIMTMANGLWHQI